MTAFGDRLRAEIEAAAKGLVLEISANLQEATPVDTGHARANWVPSIGEPFEGEADTGAAAQAGIAAVMAFTLADGSMSITNNVPYMPYLIGGSSSQAPAGWDLEAVDRAQQTIQAQYDGLVIDVDDGGTKASVTITPRAVP